MQKKNLPKNQSVLLFPWFIFNSLSDGVWKTDKRETKEMQRGFLPLSHSMFLFSSLPFNQFHFSFSWIVYLFLVFVSPPLAFPGTSFFFSDLLLSSSTCFRLAHLNWSCYIFLSISLSCFILSLSLASTLSHSFFLSLSSFTISTYSLTSLYISLEYLSCHSLHCPMVSVMSLSTFHYSLCPAPLSLYSWWQSLPCLSLYIWWQSLPCLSLSLYIWS